MKVIFPPRPKSKIYPNSLHLYEDDNWIAQRKFNGTRNLIFVSEDCQVSLFGRHGKPHKKFKLTKKLKNQILDLNFEKGKSYWLDSELLDSKTKNEKYKGKIVIFDVLQAGNYLFNIFQLNRLDILAKLCNNPTQLESNHGIAWEVTSDIWMAETFYENFKNRFQDFIHLDEIEGLVLRKKKSILGNTGKREYEVSWQIRCRKSHKSYSF